MKEFCRTVVFGFFLFLFTSVVEANENLFSEQDLKRSDVEVYWQDSLHKILLKYLKGLDAYSAKDYRSAYNIWLPMAKDGFSYAQADIAGLYFNGWGILEGLSITAEKCLNVGQFRFACVTGKKFMNLSAERPYKSKPQDAWIVVYHFATMVVP